MILKKNRKPSKIENLAEYVLKLVLYRVNQKRKIITVFGYRAPASNMHGHIRIYVTHAGL